MWVTADHTVGYATWVMVCGSRYVGDSVWVRYGVRYGAFQGYVTVRYGCALR